MIWLCGIVVSFAFAAVLILEAFEEWREEPVLVTFGDAAMPITKMQVGGNSYQVEVQE